jgi:hypothetical protein
LLGSFRARPGIEQHEFRDTRRRRPAHDFHRDVTAHRQAKEREARRRGGENAVLAIATMLSSRVWSATVTGPKRHNAGICSAYSLAEQLRPGTRTLGKASFMTVPRTRHRGKTKECF